MATSSEIKVADLMGPVLAGRGSAEQLRASVEQLLRDGADVALDFDGVLGMSPSAADELFGKLAGMAGGDRLRFDNLSADLLQVATMAHSNRGHAGNGSQEWWELLRSRGEAGIARVGLSAYMEVVADLEPPGDWSQRRLLEALRVATISAFGWPIAVNLDNRDEYRARPVTDGVVAEVAIPELSPNEPMARSSYDLWKLHTDGRFYTLLSLFEDSRKPQSLFFEVRITRITEALLLLVRLYRQLGASGADQITTIIRHKGLAGRTLQAASSNRAFWEGRSSAENEVHVEFETTLDELGSDLVGYVSRAIQPLFIVFDFFELDEAVLRDIAERFIKDASRPS